MLPFTDSFGNALLLVEAFGQVLSLVIDTPQLGGGGFPIPSKSKEGSRRIPNIRFWLQGD
jgi:hypothetical protein